ncbi:hypothetical protein VP01_8643g1 [Puccinia sorghi]|uniref:phosphoribosylaminoimidazole carboxylase n=1 Tax=Puccinia sorghi TaxID=27349 RepID=A0A0L6UAZ2_9BASI|nr:hypothetical protein VP01_8643g1 [Puccinia sorghi]
MVTSQFTTLILAITSKPLPQLELFGMVVPSATAMSGAGQRAERSQRGSIQEVQLQKGWKMAHRNVVECLPTNQTKELNFVSLSRISDKAAGGGFSDSNPLVPIIMGLDSDLPTMMDASPILSHPLFQVADKMTIVLAHWTPSGMVEYLRAAASRGVQVIIAGAGEAAHLPGMVSALTLLPVIGVPVKGKTLDGVDALVSIVQMPCGIPVATVAIGNSTNAALLAIRILSAPDSSIMTAVELI